MNSTCALCGKSDAQVPTQAFEKGLFASDSGGLWTQMTSAVDVCCNKGTERIQYHDTAFHVEKLDLKQELAALTGCVSRCRTVFSPEPVATILPGAIDEAHIIDPCQYNQISPPKLTREDNDHCDCVDCQPCITSADNSTGQLVRQHSLEYDHLNDVSSVWKEDGFVQDDKLCAVSVHFRTDVLSGHAESQRSGDEISAVPHIQCEGGSSRSLRYGEEETSLRGYGAAAKSSASKIHFTDQYASHRTNITPVDSPHLSTWPRNHRRKIHHDKVQNCVESMPLALNLMNRDRSILGCSQPTHTQGSSSSMKSLHSLCCEKPLLPYRKGIDGAVFKARMEVR